MACAAEPCANVRSLLATAVCGQVLAEVDAMA